MSTKNAVSIFSGSFESKEGSEIKIELPIECEKLSITNNGQICYIQNLLITTWGTFDQNSSFSCTYNLILNSYSLNEDSEGKDYYIASINQVSLSNSTDLFYCSPAKNNIGIEVYPKYNPLGERMDGNSGKIYIPLQSKNKEGEIKNIPPNIQIFWSILILE